MKIITLSFKYIRAKIPDVCYISEACIIENKLRGEKDDLYVGDPYPTSYKSGREYEKAENLSNRLIEKLTTSLNEHHKTSHSQLFWRTIIGFWCINFALIILDKKNRLEKAKNDFGAITIIDFGHYKNPRPTDTKDFINKSPNDFYSNRIYIDIASVLGFTINHENISAFTENKYENKEWKSFWSLHFGYIYRKLFSNKGLLFKILKRRARVALFSSYLPRFSLLKIWLSSGGKVLQYQLPEFKYETIKKYALIAESVNLLKYDPAETDEFNICTKIIDRYFPISFLEGFLKLNNFVNHNYPQAKLNTILSANAWYYNEPFKLWAAKMREEHGVKLVGAEHGGGPVVGRYKLLWNLEVSVVDQYITWGWIPQGYNKLVGIYPNKLVETRKKAFKKNQNSLILYIATFEPKNQHGQFENFCDYIYWQKIFFESINDRLKNKFIYRGHYQDKEWPIQEYLKKNHQMQFDDWAESLYQRIFDKNIGVLIFDYLGTTFWESISRNVPTILILDLVKINLHKEFIDDLILLKSVSIFFEDPSVAAKHINLVGENPNIWFYEQNCQRVVEYINTKYMSFGKKRVQAWASYFKELKDFN